MTTTTKDPRKSRMLVVPAALATMAMLGTGLAACGTTEASASGHAATHSHVDTHANAASDVTRTGRTSSEAALYTAMRLLWAQHMEWTYATVAAFAADVKGLPATLDRLLANQADIGNAVKPFYGDEAGDALTKLLKAHINGAVPILVAAKAGKTGDLDKAVAAWYANAKEIGDFLAGANPAWPKSEMEQMMKLHIDQTLTYSTAQLQGKYAASIAAYDEAEAHMQDMADMLSAGLVKQFPDKFRS
jgi:hypothetical protein